MHRTRGGLTPSFISHSHPPSLVSGRFRNRSTSASKNATKAAKQTWHKTALNFLRTATSRRAGLVPVRTRRATELKLVNSILEERHLPVAVDQDFRDVVRPMMTHFEEGTSELPSGMGPGALVEFRWKDYPLIGVILREVPDEGRNVVQTLVADGRIITHLTSGVLYVVPKFIEASHITRCGIEDKPVNSKELMARVSVAEKVRKFSKTSEDLYNGYATLFNGVYPRVSARDEEAWASVTVVEAAKLLNVQYPDRCQVLHAVYSRLMKHSQMFVMDNRNFLSSQTFYVRPRAQVERFNQVWHLMHANSPRVGQFLMRIKGTIAELQRLSKGSKNEAPSYHPAMNLAFTEDDQLFIRFFLDSLVDIRSVQTNPYSPLVCDIMKTLGLYDGDIDSEQVRQFLVDIGVLAPWQDIASLRKSQPALTIAISDPTPPVRTKSVSRSIATTSVLGPDDLYPSDPLESIRHDFGQLPVYTIDDYGGEELDDGISVERDTSDPSSLWVHVHIADPTAILPPTHSLARRARDAVQTLYFYHSSHPMLPESLVKGKLSLGNTATRGEAENVMTFSAKVDSNGDIIDYKVRAGIVRDVRTLKYDEVDTAMSFHPPVTTFPFGRFTKPDPTPLNLSPIDMENLHLLNLFSKRMVARRLSNSTFSFGLGHPELTVSPKRLPVGMVDSLRPGLFLGDPEISYAVHDPVLSGSRLIVAEAALVANRVASRFGLDHGVPLARRTLGAPVGSGEAYADLLRLRNKDGWVDFFEVRRKAIQFPMTQYTLDPAEHRVLGIAKGEGYTRATSPLRRYGDLVTHWQIKHALLHNKPLLSSREMQTIFEHVGEREQRWRWVQDSHNRWWALAFVKRWMRSDRENGAYNPITTMVGRVTARARQDVFRGTWAQEVHIADLGLFGILEGTGAEEIGAEVTMTVDKIMLTTHPVLRLKPVKDS